MPRKIIPASPGGRNTPKVTQAVAAGNTPPSVHLEIGLILSTGKLDAGSTTFAQLAALFKAIASGVSRQDPQIDAATLALLGSAVAAAHSDELGEARDRIQGAVPDLQSSHGASV